MKKNIRTIATTAIAVLGLTIVAACSIDDSTPAAPPTSKSVTAAASVPYSDWPKELLGNTIGGVTLPAEATGKIHNELLDIYTTYVGHIEDTGGTFGLFEGSGVRDAFADYLHRNYGVPSEACVQMLAVAQKTPLPARWYHDGRYAPPSEFTTAEVTAQVLARARAAGYFSKDQQVFVSRVITDTNAMAGRRTYAEFFRYLDGARASVRPGDNTSLACIDLLAASNRHHQKAFGHGDGDIVPVDSKDVALTDLLAFVDSLGNVGMAVTCSAVHMLWEMAFE